MRALDAAQPIFAAIQVAIVIPSPSPSRPGANRHRDDLTVEVIFFGEGDKSGNVEINEEATATTEPGRKDGSTPKDKKEKEGAEVKAKL